MVLLYVQLVAWQHHHKRLSCCEVAAVRYTLKTSVQWQLAAQPSGDTTGHYYIGGAADCCCPPGTLLRFHRLRGWFAS